MGLVDYSSSDNDSDTSRNEHAQPPAKKPRTSSSPAAAAATATATATATPSIPSQPHQPRTTTTSTLLPPLPSSFHNLYATTVRPFTADLPSLHQGRKRLIPHVDGNWPSHIYVEWHPDPAHHEALSSLIRSLQSDLQQQQSLLDSANGHGGGDHHHHHHHHELTSFLTSDLGAPLPLHISLSRPFVLRTDQKTAFRDALARRISRLGDVAAPFELRFVVDGDDDDDGHGKKKKGLAWFRSAEASRSFLVLRVRSAAQAQGQQQQQEGKRLNPQLAALLAACNEVVAAHGQPRLYAARGSDDGFDPGEGNVDGARGGGVRSVEDEEEEEEEGVDGAFHVSIAWSFAEPTDEIRARTAAAFFAHEKKEEGGRRKGGLLRSARIPVDSIKVKIGNVVSDIPLVEKRGKKGSAEGRALFGI